MAALHGTRLEQAIERCLGEYPEFSEVQERGLAHKACNHVMAHMPALRSLVQEDENSIGGGGRRYQKSGGFRKKCHAQDWAQLTQVMRGSLSSCADDREPAAAGADEPEVDESGWPTLFR